MCYAIIGVVIIVLGTEVTNVFDTELIKSMGPEGLAILAGIEFSILTCSFTLLITQINRTMDRIEFLKQQIEENEEDDQGGMK